MAITDEVVELIRLSRDRTVALTDQQVVAITTAWVNAWDELAPEFQDALSNLLSNTDEKIISVRTVARDRRIAQALEQSKHRLDELAAQTEVIVANDVSTVVLDAARSRYNTLLAQLPEGQTHIALSQLNQITLDAIVARTTQQINSARLPIPDDAVAAMRAELIRGITVGSNPNETARRIIRRTEGTFNGGLVRATRIARTEMIMAHRTADLELARQNTNVIEEWQWLTTLDPRTCSACLAMHGKTFPKDTYGPAGHVQCRCARIDKTKSWEELGFAGIEDNSLDLVAQRDAWWENLTEDAKQDILGPGRYNLYQSNQVSWDDMVTFKRNSDWMDHYIQTPLKDLITK